MDRLPLGLLALIGWTLFAFAGAYPWTTWPVMLAAGVLVVLVRPAIVAARARHLDAALLLVLLAVGLQALPLPLSLRDTLSPAAARLDDTLRFGSTGALATLSVDAARTRGSLALAATVVVIFWIARSQFERGGLRHVARGLAWMGLVLAIVVFVQRYASPHHIYGFWAPVTRSANPTPFGPYVNRNDLATWLLLAIPVISGYLVGRTLTHARGRHWTTALERVIEPRSLLLAGSVALMSAALVASLSRSGMVGLLTACLVLVMLGRRHLGGAGTRVFGTSVTVVLLLAVPFTNLAAMAFRLGDSLASDVGGRVAIWHDAWRMAREFPGTGIGTGAFPVGMLVYQGEPRMLFFNHAHNEYLQVIAEGGMLVALPLAMAVIGFVALARRELRRDVPTVFWFRLGALAGLCGVAVQSVWDTGLRMPANAVLFAVVSAMAVHRSRHSPAGSPETER